MTAARPSASSIYYMGLPPACHFYYF